MFKRIYKARWCYLALLPTVFFLALFMLYPAIEGIIKSLYLWKQTNYFNPQFIGLDNYIRLMGDAEFWKAFAVLVVFVIWGLIATFVINMPISYLVNKLGATKRGRFVQKAYVIPMMVPSMVITLYWKFFYEFQNGILNNVLRAVGLEEMATVWLGNAGTALIAVLFVGFPFVGGFAYLTLLAGFQGVDKSLHEAADIEGITAVKKFFRIDIPLIMPQIKVLLMISMITGIQQFGTQMVMTNGRYGTMVPGLYMYQTAFSYGNYGYASAMGVMLFIIILIITIIQNKVVSE